MKGLHCTGKHFTCGKSVFTEINVFTVFLVIRSQGQGNLILLKIECKDTLSCLFDAGKIFKSNQLKYLSKDKSSYLSLDMVCN